MQPKTAEKNMAEIKNSSTIILELSVNNHPGVMSHICGLFSRRAYNLEKILCFPIPQSRVSQMWLKVNEENNLDQVIKQIEKLEDVRQVQYLENNENFFSKLEIMVNS